MAFFARSITVNRNSDITIEGNHFVLEVQGNREHWCDCEISRVGSNRYDQRRPIIEYLRDVEDVVGYLAVGIIG